MKTKRILSCVVALSCLLPVAGCNKQETADTNDVPTLLYLVPGDPQSDEAAVEATAAPAATAAAGATEAAVAETQPESTEASPAEATPEVTEAPTPEPTPRVVVPTVTLKPAAQATVYHSSNGQWYHSFNRCSGMTGGGAYSLEECAATHKQCRACGAPGVEMIGQNCLWKDEFNRCHTSDACTGFEGKYMLVLRDDALEQGLAACDKCGAQEYLAPNTIIDYSALPTVEPTLEPVA